MVNFIWVPIVVGLLAVLFAAYLVSYVLRKDRGTPEMQKIANAIFAGATAYLNRQYRTIALLSIVVGLVVAAALAFLGQGSQADKIDLAWHTAVAFLVGALCSGISGYIGMYVAVQSNSRTASAARRSLGEALVVSLRGGAVSGFLVVALSLLGVSALFLLFGGYVNAGHTPSLLVGFGFGASFVALFAQLGGGIYTKAADVGADLVGKVEANIPEDDPRNPAVIADLVGDNVGDCAGRGADLFESTAAENIGTMILGATLYQATGNIGWMLFPLVVGAFGIIASAIGVLYVRASNVIEPDKAVGRDPSQIAMNQLNIGYYITCIISVIGIFLGSYLLLGGNAVPANYSIPAWVWYGLAGCVGILLSVAFVFITQYYTAGTWRPVREIAESSITGPATTIISGITIGFECVVMPALAISAALGLSYFFGSQVQLPVELQRLGVINVSGIFGTAIATVGMLMSCAYVLTMDTFGPITDNAGGITEMSGQPEAVRQITDALDSVGNTTKALTKGYGLGSAALAAFLLFSAYLDVLYGFKHDATVYRVDIANIAIFIAALLGLTLIFFFCSLAIRAVGTASKRMIEEVRRQFREMPNIMADDPADRVDPDYARCVDISTNGALRAMILPGAIAVLTPIAVGMILGPQAAAGMLMVSTMGGIVVALFLNNGGGAWDNAKKYIESGFLRANVKGQVVSRTDPEGIVLGKNSEAHKASVIGDTVGDPFKDTAGPSLHVLIKLLSTITLVLAPLFYLLHG
ncbi:K(+)-stimulated pyrophosphate-energized sodium pump [Thermosporothrix hazakensis]|jgi:K(+)-stimulated pyrophosphate-energized sodium pump|uniref:K(+)-insensitive pyrophosphate-energized proton pump n=1 Tax=Thermosporothrix hazakensis TaxID=644383 RepID=A0A326U6Y3_THEHA|nr:sodium-translocating pyrophosphatase [Thermosporothrix hazakensis]PZW30487.1 K(+)-stimulated pyrophosphate-energized sodium pump [Thermosporothrix hazakensis]GCE49347.1 K(+)-insensitive pyrophosphate-energized proton pump [Thermosporothrix hazakensis]